MSATDAIAALVRRGLLKGADVAALGPEAKELLTMGLLQLRTGETRDDTLDAISPDVLAFAHFPRNSAELATWVTTYPHAADRVLLMVMGRICRATAYPGQGDAGRIARDWGLVLWNYRTSAVDSAWLQESADSVFFNPGPQWAGADVLGETRSLLQSTSPSHWNLTEQQHQDLLDLCDRLEAQRNELNTAPSPVGAAYN